MINFVLFICFVKKYDIGSKIRNNKKSNKNFRFFYLGFGNNFNGNVWFLCKREEKKIKGFLNFLLMCVKCRKKS